MEVVVVRAGQLARPGDTVLLAPGFAAEALVTPDGPGQAFVAAVRGRSDDAGDPAGGRAER